MNKSVSVDCAFGGMIYAIVDIDRNPGLPQIQPQNGKALAKLGEEIKVSFPRFIQRVMIHYLKKKVGVVDFEKFTTPVLFWR